jgi:NitT/TauT family transport system permease protein
MSTAATPLRRAAPVRPEYERAVARVEASLPVAPQARQWQLPGAARRGLVLLALAIAWEIAARLVDDDLLLPGFLQTARAFYESCVSGELPRRVAASLIVLAQGYGLGVIGAFALTALAASTRIGRDVLGTLVAMFNPLPAIALLPLALLWFGLGNGSLVFVLVHSVLWPLSLNIFAGFQSVPETLRMSGRNIGLRGPRYVFQLLVPAALPAILSGLKVSWAFAWRTLIAAELVFGATSRQGGLGWYIFQNRNELYTDRVFAGLAMVILLGLLVEAVVFAGLERVTVRRWGMQRG